MVKLVLTEDERVIIDLVGRETFLRARHRVTQGEVQQVKWSAERTQVSAVIADPTSSLEVLVDVVQQGVRLSHLVPHCPCTARSTCHHAVAAVLAGLPKGRTSLRGKAPLPELPARTPAWEKALEAVVRLEPATAIESDPPIALQFQVTAPGGVERVALFPVAKLAGDKWMRSGVSWTTLRWLPSRRRHEHMELFVDLLEELRGIASGGQYLVGNAILLTEAPSRRVWDVLLELQDTGLPMMQSKGAAPVVLHREPVEAVVRTQRTPTGIELAPFLHVDGQDVAFPPHLRCGHPAHGLVWREGAQMVGPGPLHLARLASPLSNSLAERLIERPLSVPARDEQRFVESYLPLLAQHMRVIGDDPALVPAPPAPPVLSLQVGHHDDHRTTLSWEWVYATGVLRRHESLAPDLPPTSHRDLAAEQEVLARVVALPAVQLICETGTADGLVRLAEHAQLDGVDTARFVSDVLPLLQQVDGVEVTETGQATAYREVDEAPTMIFAAADADAPFGEQDWFDLAVQVSVGGESVPYQALFSSLALEEKHLLLPSGTWFSLERDEYRQLAELISEARAMQDSDRGTVRLTRFQADMWAELERLGVVTGQAAQWQASVRALTDAGDLVERALPAGLNATLRPYQEQGFQWLSALFSRRLGGVLADDMGLGKTLQTLAFVLSLKERGELEGPALVVCPTSLISNWANEAARFTPDLRVVTVTETTGRRGTSFAEQIADADLVVTSYTLFRLEYDDYEALPWTALVLDEAQFVKNHASRSHHAAKRLPARFKVAITGTPMENNLMELWALLAITAPGLFPSPQRFTEYYRVPIEKQGDADRLAQLRRRLRPLMLRRTKEVVARDLPDKQEQVMELELDPRHRRAYQRHLDRERQKVLGLIGDLSQHRFEIFRSLTLLRQAALDVGLVDPDASAVPSTKLDALMTLVQDAVAEGHRVVVFSQFTRFLSSARDRITEAGIPLAYLDGRTRNREKVLTRFREGEAPVFLISLKAGGFGLNLTEADYCILLDPWWNPATEAQAVDRIHRIGQSRKVLVYRLVSKGTIEEKVMALKARKAELFAGVLGDGAFESAALNASDIRELLA